MPIARYFRLTGFSVNGDGPLELSEARLYAGGILADASATIASTIAPSSGLLSYLKDGLVTEAVSWQASAHTAAGFALVWDFGPGGADISQARLGSGSAAATFPVALIAQLSDDALSWSTHSTPNAIVYPGSYSFTQAPSSSGSGSGSSDPHADKVILALTMDGTDGSTVFPDTSPVVHTVSANGAAQISTAKSRYGTGSLLLNGSDANLSAAPANFALGTSTDFCIEFDAWRSSTKGDAVALTTMLSSGGSGGWWFNFQGAGVSIYADGAEVLSAASVGSAVSAWVHWALTREDNVYKLFKEGVQIATATGSRNFIASVFRVGGGNLGGFDGWFNGYLDNVRITKGAARYTTNFVPANWATGPAGPFLPVAGPSAPRWRRHLSRPSSIQGQAFPAVGSARAAAVATTFLDAYNGGVGTVYGTVKEKRTPANTPLYRRVLLIDERSRLTIRETWSHPVTGAFEFRGVRSDVKYTVISYDHLDNYRAVLANGLGAEVAP